MSIRVLDLKGTPEQIGRAHGRAYGDDIRRYCDERIHLVMSGLWSGNRLTRPDVLAIAESCLPHHESFADDLTTEMIAVGEAARLTPAEMVIVGGFTDFVDAVRASTGGDLPPEVIEDDCTAFLTPNHRSRGSGFFGQTWDMHDTATQFVVLADIAADHKPRSMVFTTTGCIGQIGMNELGLSVGINNLTGAHGRPGVTWPFVVRKALEQTSAEAAKDVILAAPVAGAHNFLIMDADGVGYNIEAMASRSSVTKLEEDPIVHTNHALDPDSIAVQIPRPAQLQESSEQRLATARALLAEGEITEEMLMALTREEGSICQVAYDPYRVESCGATIMRPATKDFWAVWGLPSENEYEHFTLGAT